MALLLTGSDQPGRKPASNQVTTQRVEVSGQEESEDRRLPLLWLPMIAAVCSASQRPRKCCFVLAHVTRESVNEFPVGIPVFHSEANIQNHLNFEGLAFRRSLTIAVVGRLSQHQQILACI